MIPANKNNKLQNFHFQSHPPSSFESSYRTRRHHPVFASVSFFRVSRVSPKLVLRSRWKASHAFTFVRHLGILSSYSTDRGCLLKKSEFFFHVSPQNPGGGGVARSWRTTAVPTGRVSTCWCRRSRRSRSTSGPLDRSIDRQIPIPIFPYFILWIMCSFFCWYCIFFMNKWWIV